MDRQPVSSSSLTSVGYSSDDALLEIEFNDGRIYQYFDVPSLVYEALVGAESVGNYFASNIRGVYRYCRL